MIYLSLCSQCIERNWIRMGLFWGLILLFSSLLKNIPLLNTGTKNSRMKTVSWKLISFSTFVRVITYASLGRFAKKTFFYFTQFFALIATLLLGTVWIMFVTPYPPPPPSPLGITWRKNYEFGPCLKCLLCSSSLEISRTSKLSESYIFNKLLKGHRLKSCNVPYV